MIDRNLILSAIVLNLVESPVYAIPDIAALTHCMIEYIEPTLASL